MAFRSLVKKMEDTPLIETEEENLKLLNTIKIPKKMSLITESLPKPNYYPMKVKKSVKYRSTTSIKTMNNNTIEDNSQMNNSIDLSRIENYKPSNNKVTGKNNNLMLPAILKQNINSNNKAMKKKNHKLKNYELNESCENSIISDDNVIYFNIILYFYIKKY